MKRWKSLLHRFLFPGPAVVLLSVPVGFGLLAYAFLFAGEDSPVAYLSYVLSAYSLTVVCAALIKVVPQGRAWLLRNPLVHRYLSDVPFQLRVSLYGSLLVNLLYALMNAFSGLYYRSPWFGSLAAYYICLSVMRFSLVRYAHRHGFGENRGAEWRRYRLCGIVLIVMNLALAGVVILVLHRGGGFSYGGSLIYAMALYTFYITITSVVHVVRYRRYNSPVMSAAKRINLVAALVSMLSLETAMLARFGSREDAPYFRPLMTASTGGAVCLIVVVMGISMTVHANRQLKSAKS